MKKTMLVVMLALLSTPARAAPDPNETMALVSAVASFAADSCPAIKPNITFITRAFTRLGVRQENMLREPYRSKILNTVASFDANAPYYCESVTTLFGPQGTIIPGIVEQR